MIKTLVIISHPQIKDSYTQSFLKAAQSDLSDIKWHPLDLLYSDAKINVAHEQKLLMWADRVIFQFPLYWYSSPALLKKWEDEVLVRRFANASQGGYLRHRQLGLVVTLGTPLKEYQAGGDEHFSLSELLTPFQALATKAGMKYLRPFIISQFPYQVPRNEARILANYRNYLTNPHPFSLKSQLNWLLKQLTMVRPHDSKNRIIFDAVLQQIKNNQDQLDDLKNQINLIKRKDDD